MNKSAAVLLAVAGLAGCVAYPVAPGYHGGGYHDRDRDRVANRYDRDRDGVPNRYDRRPNNSRRH